MRKTASMVITSQPILCTGLATPRLFFEDRSDRMLRKCFLPSFALSVIFCGGLLLGAEPVPNRRVLVLQAPPVVSVNAVAVSPDGSLVATAAEGVCVYDARTGGLLRAIGEAGDRWGGCAGRWKGIAIGFVPSPLRRMARRSPAAAAIGPTTAGAIRLISRDATRVARASGNSGMRPPATSSGPSTSRGACGRSLSNLVA